MVTLHYRPYISGPELLYLNEPPVGVAVILVLRRSLVVSVSGRGGGGDVVEVELALLQPLEQRLHHGEEVPQDGGCEKLRNCLILPNFELSSEPNNWESEEKRRDSHF